MQFTENDIKDYSHKLLIDLKDEEVKNLTDEFSEIDEDMGLLNKIEGLEKIEPMHMVPFCEEVILREDKSNNELTPEEVIKNCDDVKDGEVKVPKVVG